MARRYVADVGKYAFEFRLLLDIRSEGGEFVPLLFLLDTGTDFMNIPQHLARQSGIAFATDSPVYPLTASGRASQPSYLSPVYYSFPQLPELQFKVDCAFCPCDDLPYGLFSLTDFVPHFVVRSHKENSDYPEGSVVFQLRADHKGSPRA